MQTRKPTLKHSLLAGSIAIFLPLLAQAQPMAEDGHSRCGDMPPGHHGAHMMPDEKLAEGGLPPFLHGLNLTDAQRDGIFNILHTQAPLVYKKAKSLHQAQEELHALIVSSKYEDAKAKELAESAAESLADLALLRAQSEHQIYTLLTPEQRRQVEEMKAKPEFRPTSGTRLGNFLRAI